MDNALKGLIIAAGVAITCFIISIGFYFARESKTISAESANNLNDFSNELSESDITMYDGLEITGSDVVNFIKKELGEYGDSDTAPFYVFVKTVIAENTYQNNINFANMQNFTHSMYIKPISKFIGEVVRDGNNVIIGIRFIQK